MLPALPSRRAHSSSRAATPALVVTARRALTCLGECCFEDGLPIDCLLTYGYRLISALAITPAGAYFLWPSAHGDDHHGHEEHHEEHHEEAEAKEEEQPQEEESKDEEPKEEESKVEEFALNLDEDEEEEAAPEEKPLMIRLSLGGATFDVEYAAAEESFNWVDDVGGLPSYIKRIANAIQKKGKSESHSIAIAVNVDSSTGSAAVLCRNGIFCVRSRWTTSVCDTRLSMREETKPGRWAR